MSRATLSMSVTAGNAGDEVPHGDDICSISLHVDLPRKSNRPMHTKDLSTLLTQPKGVLPVPGKPVGVSTKGVYVREDFPQSLQNSRTR